MTPIKKITGTLFTGLLLTGLTLNFNACTEQSPFEAISTKDQTATLNKGPRLSPEGDTATGNTVEQGSMTSRYYKKWDEYQGGKINLSQGSQFELLYGALTPPAELSGQNVTLTMTVVQDRANNELLFEFGPIA